MDEIRIWHYGNFNKNITTPWQNGKFPYFCRMKKEPINEKYPLTPYTMEEIYAMVEEHIEVVAFWDVRREPKELVEGLEEAE